MTKREISYYHLKWLRVLLLVQLVGLQGIPCITLRCGLVMLYFFNRPTMLCLKLLLHQSPCEHLYAGWAAIGEWAGTYRHISARRTCSTVRVSLAVPTSSPLRFLYVISLKLYVNINFFTPQWPFSNSKIIWTQINLTTNYTTWRYWRKANAFASCLWPTANHSARSIYSTPTR